jgi:hypothetical protein
MEVLAICCPAGSCLARGLFLPRRYERRGLRCPKLGFLFARGQQLSRARRYCRSIKAHESTTAIETRARAQTTALVRYIEEVQMKLILRRPGRAYDQTGVCAARECPDRFAIFADLE